MLSGLKELYVLFKESEPEFLISYSKFAQLRPKYCILPGSPGTHSVCVCTIHQNVKLMLDAINIPVLTKNSDIPITNYKDCLSHIICKNFDPNCYLDKCLNCPGTTKFRKCLLELLDNSSISHVQCSLWSATDRSTLVTQTMKVDEFVNEFCYKLEILKSHSFIAKQQTSFINEKKKNLKKGEVIVMFDFSEN